MMKRHFRRLSPHIPPPLTFYGRRWAALIYDGFICVALLIATTLIWVLCLQGQVVPASLQLYYQSHLLIMLFGYWLVSWYWGGQTLGMRAWRLKLISTTDQLRGWQLILRCLLAPLTLFLGGLGWWWWLWNPTQALYDQWTHTQIVLITPLSKY